MRIPNWNHLSRIFEKKFQNYKLMHFFSRRPETSFLWFASPFRTFKNIIWRKSKWYIIGTLLLVCFIIFLLLFLWAMPVSFPKESLLIFLKWTSFVFSLLYGLEFFIYPGDRIYSSILIIRKFIFFSDPVLFLNKYLSSKQYSASVNGWSRTIFSATNEEW